MPRKKKDTTAEKRKNAQMKLTFIILIIALITLTNVIVGLQDSDNQSEARSITSSEALSKELNESKEEVLGQTSEAEEKLAQEVRRHVQNVRDQLFSQSRTIADKGKERVEERFGTIVYNNTLKPIVEKINNLPEDQQEYIREAICRDPQLDPNLDQSVDN